MEASEVGHAHGRRGGAGTTTRVRAAHIGPERRRPQVLDAAFELFLDRGYEGTSIQAIADSLGVSKPVVYACYPSKEELFKALLRREEERVLTQIAEALPSSADGEDLERTLVRGFTAFLRAVAASPRAYRVVFLGEGGANAAVAQRAQRGRERQVDAIASLARPLLRGIDSDAELDRAARLLGHLVAGLAESGARAMLSEEGAWTPETLGEVLGRLAARGTDAARQASLPGGGSQSSRVL
jgi:AcrR family transcriptional regulator